MMQKTHHTHEKGMSDEEECMEWTVLTCLLWRILKQKYQDKDYLILLYTLIRVCRKNPTE